MGIFSPPKHRVRKGKGPLGCRVHPCRYWHRRTRAGGLARRPPHPRGRARVVVARAMLGVANIKGGGRQALSRLRLRHNERALRGQPDDLGAGGK
eukprot:7529785-Pyramimonas_sp.AAC.1